MNRTSLSGVFALSPMQQGMLFHYLKEPHSGVDIEQIVVHFPEKIDAQPIGNGVAVAGKTPRYFAHEVCLGGQRDTAGSIA